MLHQALYARDLLKSYSEMSKHTWTLPTPTDWLTCKSTGVRSGLEQLLELNTGVVHGLTAGSKLRANTHLVLPPAEARAEGEGKPGKGKPGGEADPLPPQLGEFVEVEVEPDGTARITGLALDVAGQGHVAARGMRSATPVPSVA